MNIREAEERARLERPGYLDSAQTARDFLALAALYREAVEALEMARSKYAGLAMTVTKDVAARAAWHMVVRDLDAVLAKARAALCKTCGGSGIVPAQGESNYNDVCPDCGYDREKK